MNEITKRILDENGRYDRNKGYKEICATNADEAFALIEEQLTDIMSQPYLLSRRSTYRTPSHDPKENNSVSNQYKEHKGDSKFRKEEWLCKECQQRCCTDVGKIVDYQVPLKHTNRKGEDGQPLCAGMGKIDLLAQKDDVGYLLELKVPDSQEEPLRAIMEIYTYWKQLGGDDCRNFLENSALNGANKLKKGVLLYPSENPRSIYQKLRRSESNFRSLMKDLDVLCFVAITDKTKQDPDEREFIQDIVLWF